MEFQYTMSHQDAHQEHLVLHHYWNGSIIQWTLIVIINNELGDVNELHTRVGHSGIVVGTRKRMLI
jgi:hypothetical protein